MEKMNLLYAGVENPLRVAVEDIPDSNLLLVPSLGRIQKHSPGYYTWSFCQFDTNVATLVLRDTVQGITVGQYQYRLRDLPEPEAYVTVPDRQHQVPCGTLKASGGLAMVYACCDFDARANVVSYEVWRIPKKGDAILRHNRGARFTSDTQDLINQAVPGDIYVFRNIIYNSCALQRRYSAQELMFRIK